MCFAGGGIDEDMEAPKQQLSKKEEEASLESVKVTNQFHGQMEERLLGPFWRSKGIDEDGF